MADHYLTEFKNHPQAWSRVVQIMEQSQTPNTKYFALGILEEVVKTQWRALPEVQSEGRCGGGWGMHLSVGVW